MKKLFLITCIFIFLFTNTFAYNTDNKVKKVVIDAGHGGKDPGCKGAFSYEKDIVLKLALKLGALINANFPDVEVIYTRKTDVFIPLYKRAKIANDNNADLFISIHINANTSATPSGTETYVMGLHKSKANLEVAKKENAAILLEDNYMSQYNGYNPNSPEANIIFSLYQNVFLDQSLELASYIQDYFTTEIGLKNRGVKQAGFLVLYKTTMPGVLVEVGFLTNSEEEKILNKEKNQNKIAMSIFQAFNTYKKSIEGTEKKEQIFIDPNKDSVKESEKKESNPKPKDQEKREVFFAVQIGTSPKEKVLNSIDFKGLKNVNSYKHNRCFKYYVGNEKSIDDAKELLRKVRKSGIKDAFIIAFNKNERISTKKAKELLKESKK